MSEQGIRIELRREAFDRVIEALATFTDDLSQPGEAIALALEESVRKNFEDGGRPDKWPVSKRAAGDRGQTLRDTDRLYNSIASEFDQAAGGVRVGTSVEYAAAHHFGVDKKVEQQVDAHLRRITQAFGRELKFPVWVNVGEHGRTIHQRIPARPFMLMQEEDWATVQEIIRAEIESIMQEGRR